MHRAFTALLVLLGACASEPGSENQTQAQPGERERGNYIVDGETGEISARIHREDGTVATMRSGEKVPVLLPAGFTLYPGAEVVSNTHVRHDGGNGVLLTMRSRDDPEDMTAFYRQQAEAAGVTVEMQMKAGRTAMFAGKGPGDLAVSFNVSEETGETVAQLMVGTGME